MWRESRPNPWIYPRLSVFKSFDKRELFDRNKLSLSAQFSLIWAIKLDRMQTRNHHASSMSTMIHCSQRDPISDSIVFDGSNLALFIGLPEWPLPVRHWIWLKNAHTQQLPLKFNIVGHFRDNFISRFLKGDILRHLIFAILENFFKPSHLILRDNRLSRH